MCGQRANPSLVAVELCPAPRCSGRERLNENSWSRSGDWAVRLFGQPTFKRRPLETNVSTQTNMGKPPAARLCQNPCVGYSEQISRFLSGQKCRRTVLSSVDHVANTITLMA